MSNKQNDEKRKETQKAIAETFDRLLVLIQAGSDTGLVDTDAFDKVFKDVFNVKKFGTNLIRARHTRSFNNIARVMTEFGVKTVLDITNDEAVFYALRDLVAMRAEIDELEYKIHKAEKKELAPKAKWVDNLNKYEKMYRKTTKTLRKMYGISGDGEFPGIEELLNSRKGYGYNNMSSFSDMSFGNSIGPLFDDEDDWGERPKKRVGRNQTIGDLGSSTGFDLAFGENYDEEDDDDDSDELISELDSRMSRIEEAVNIIAGNYIAENNSGSASSKKRTKTRTTSNNKEITMYDLAEMIGTVATGVSDLSSRLDDLENDFYEDDEEEEEVAIPFKVARPSASEQAAIDKDVLDALLVNASGNSLGE